MTFNVQLDWQAYYERFKESHGTPVQYHGKVLFPDGWQYALDHAGPEWMPPIDPTELTKLRIDYWTLRASIIGEELSQLRTQVEGLKDLQRIKSVPLQQLVMVIGDDGQRRVQRQDIDIQAIEQGRLAWLEQDAVECQRQLQELKGLPVASNSVPLMEPAYGNDL